jgi:hypothetical protein
MLTIAATKGWIVHQIDFDTAFLNGDLQEEIYVKVNEDGKSVHYKLLKSLYGLKQAPLRWFVKLTESISNFGFKPLASECCIFKNQTTCCFLVIYVDDLLVIGPTLDLVNDIKTKLSECFSLKDMKDVSSFLRVRMVRDDKQNVFLLDQKDYIQTLLDKYGLAQAKCAQTPMDHDINVGDCYSDDSLREWNGSLLYLAQVTRPDIVFATSFLARFGEKSNSSVKDLCKRVLRYLSGTKDKRLVLGGKQELNVTAYVDADHGMDPNTRRSITGYCIYLGKSLVSWKSKLQPLVTLSSTEAEFVALTQVLQQLKWLTKLLREVIDLQPEVLVYEDNQSTIKMAHGAIGKARTRHMDIRYHYVVDEFKKGWFKLCHVKTQDNVADLFTKPLSRKLHLKHLSYLLQ